METEKDIKELFERYLSGQCNAEEITRLYEYFGVAANHRLLQGCIANALSRSDYAPRAVVYRAQQVADRVGIRLQENVTANQLKPRSRVLRWLPYVAALLIATAVGWWTYSDRLPQVDERPSSTNSDVVDIAPGTNRATLTLAGGGTIDLSEAQVGIVMGEGISYLDGSVINLEDKGSATGKGSPNVNEYILSTPKGGTYQIKLPDGSNVWLNAASTLRYPSRFSNEERIVFLEGEAYFEVSQQTSYEAKNVPFKVITGAQTIEVLGTAFNISAYLDEAEAKTTLVEGSVKIENLISKTSSLLKAGQQATIRGSYTDIKNVDVDQYTAWKSGRFHFKHTPFNEMIGQVARWYDVEVIYRDDVPKETFSGKMGRELTLREMLGLLNISDATIRLEGRMLIVQ